MSKKKVIIKDKKLCKRYNEKKKNKFFAYWDIKKIISLQSCLDSIGSNILPSDYTNVDPVDSLTYYEKMTDDIINKQKYLKNKYNFYRNLVLPLLIIGLISGIIISFLIGIYVGGVLS